MSRFLVALVVLGACSGTTSGTTSDTIAEPTIGTDPAQVTPTSEDGVEVSVQGCETPPVTFSPLCEIYELLETWYVDAPIDPSVLADLALEGLAAYQPTTTEDPGRTLFCSIPKSDFTVLCDAIAQRVEDSMLPVGPAVEAAMSHMIDVGLDPFTYYLPPEQTGALRLNGIVGGIGVVLDARDAAGSKCTTVTESCRLEVAVVLEDNPAFEAGLLVGDVITAVDGEAVAGMGFTAVVALIAGDETGTVTLTVERDGAPGEHTIERTELEVPTVEVALPIGDVGYVRIPDFELDIPPLVTDALTEVSEVGTIVLDLRDNPGGYLDAYLEVADDFVDGGVVLVTESSHEHVEYVADPGGPATSQRLIVLVNQGTASAGEILAASLRESREAIVVGTNTFGKDAVQIPFTLRNGGEFYVAVARWSTPDGDTAGNGGLTPDYLVEWPSGASVEEVVTIALEAAS